MQQRLAARRKADEAKIEAIEGYFKEFVNVKDACYKLLHKRTALVHDFIPPDAAAEGKDDSGATSSSSTAAAESKAKEDAESDKGAGGDVVTQFDDVATAVPPNAWVELLDDSNTPYYHNARTGESTWEAPEEYLLSKQKGMEASLTGLATFSEDVRALEAMPH